VEYRLLAHSRLHLFVLSCTQFAIFFTVLQVGEPRATEYNSLFSQLEQEDNQLPHIKYFETSTGSRIQNGEPVRFEWDVSGDLQTFFIRGEQGTEGVVSPGSTTSRPTQTSVYTLIARNDYGEVRQSIEVVVYP